MNLKDADLQIVNGRRLVVTLPIWQIGSIIVGAVSIVGSVWLTQRDLTREVARLGGSVDALVARLGVMDDEQDTMDRRLLLLERNGKP